MPSVLRSVAVFSFVSAVALLSAPGCSEQGEGERCDSAKNGDLDCDDGLVCIKASQLSDGVTDRCCPVEVTEGGESCTRSGNDAPDSEGGAAGAGPAGGGAAGAAPDAAGGTSAGQSTGGVPSSSGSGNVSEGGAGAPGGGAPAAGAATGGAGNPSNGGQGGAD